MKTQMKSTMIKVGSIPFFTAKTNKRPVAEWETLELWECPLCGGTPEIIFASTGNSARIVCTSCGLITQPAWMGAGGQRGILHDLSAYWNRNVLLPAVMEKDAMIEAMEGLTWTEADILAYSYHQKETKRAYRRNTDIEAEFTQ